VTATVYAMRWQELFADLEAQASALERAATDGEISERTRGEVARVALVNRLRAQVGSHLTARVWGAGDVSGRLDRVGADWVLVVAESEVIVPTSALVVCVDLPLESTSADAVSVVSSRLTLTSILRAVARDRSAVTVVTRDGATVTGTPDRVGADFVDVAVHEAGRAPRRSEVSSRATISVAAIGCVRRRATGWEV
jgi:hypothetical protein